MAPVTASAVRMGEAGGVLMGGGVVNIVNGNCGLCAGGVFFFTRE